MTGSLMEERLAPSDSAMPDLVLDTYRTWCECLDTECDDAHRLDEAVQVLYQGGEAFRSFIQFLARIGQPHRGQGNAPDASFEATAMRRSYTAMQIACRVLTDPIIATSDNLQVLSLVCYELVGALQPSSMGYSMHICVVLQHMLSAHHQDICGMLLHSNLPFVLLRTLNRPGCAELLLGLVLGSDVMLPSLVCGGSPLRQLSTAAVQQVQQYLLRTRWPALLAALLQQVSQRAAAEAASSRAERKLSMQELPSGARTPPRRRSFDRRLESPPRTPLQSGGNFQIFQDEPSATPPQLCTPPRRPTSLSVSTPPMRECVCQRTPLQARTSFDDAPSWPEVQPQVTATEGGAAMLIEFLACALEVSGRASETLCRARQPPPDVEDLEHRAALRLQLLRSLFAETSIVTHLFELLSCGAVQCEAAELLHTLLQHVLDRRRGLSSLSEPLLVQFAASVDSLGNLLLEGASGYGAQGQDLAGQKAEVRLNGYKVTEPLGSFRVVVVQILAAIVALGPDRALYLVKPAVWALLVQWFLAHRCNHIFQAACGRLWIAVVDHGGPKLQHLVLVKLCLLSRMCDVVLNEKMGGNWHKPQVVRGSIQPPTRAKHPGGLGGIMPVLTALARVHREGQLLRPIASGQCAVPAQRSGDGERKPLAPRAGTQSQAVPQQSSIKPDVKRDTCHVASLLAGTCEWPLVIDWLGAVGEQDHGRKTLPDKSFLEPRTSRGAARTSSAGEPTGVA